MKKVLIIGAGFGGLSAAAELARAGQDVTVLEAHVYAGGCAGTFYHQGYRFDAGATLAGGFAPGAPMDLLGQRFGIDWEAQIASNAMQVHLPGRDVITRWTDDEHWREERWNAFGAGAEPFWAWQENTANVLWDFALRLPPWPPQSLNDMLAMVRTGLGWTRDQYRFITKNRLSSILKDTIQPVATHIPNSPDHLRLFLDAQLLIASQTTSQYANALYGAVALDLPRQGVAHLPGGMGGMADKMVESVRQLGGQVHMRQEVTRVRYSKDTPIKVQTKRGKIFEAEQVIFNLPPWNIAPLLSEDLPGRLRNLPERPHYGWGAFMLYAGFEGSILPENFPLHHQIVVDEPLGEGNSLFLSFSPDWDSSRAPTGKRALTVSTHTNLADWWNIYENDPDGYERLKQAYSDQMLTVIEQVIPGFRAAADLVLPGTPVTFNRFTRRAWGWVGGFPQTDLLRVWGPRIAPRLWMVGDTIFPGQSVPAVMLGGVRTGGAVLAEMLRSRRAFWSVPRLKAERVIHKAT